MRPSAQRPGRRTHRLAWPSTPHACPAGTVQADEGVHAFSPMVSERTRAQAQRRLKARGRCRLEARTQRRPEACARRLEARAQRRLEARTHQGVKAHAQRKLEGFCLARVCREAAVPVAVWPPVDITVDASRTASWLDASYTTSRLNASRAGVVGIGARCSWSVWV